MSDAASDAPTDAMTAEEVALRLKISKSGVYALIKAGAIGHYKVGRKIRFSAAAGQCGLRDLRAGSDP